jgi:hypothetical protein
MRCIALFVLIFALAKALAEAMTEARQAQVRRLLILVA